MKARAVMTTVMQLARQAYIGRERLIADGVRMEPLPNDEEVRRVLGIPAPQPEDKIIKPKPGLAQRLGLRH
jgi:hypothetical protein